MSSVSLAHEVTRLFLCSHMKRRSRGAKRPSFALFLDPLRVKRAQGRPGAGWHPRSAALKYLHTQMRRRTTGGPENTRPSLRDGSTAYARSPRSRVPSGLRHLANWRCIATRLGPDPSPQGLTVATTVRTTRFRRTQPARRRPRASPDVSAVRPHAVRPHEVHLALAPPSRARHCRVHRSPVHVRDDVRSPLSPDRDGGRVPYFRISLKWNIFAAEG